MKRIILLALLLCGAAAYAVTPANQQLTDMMRKTDPKTLDGNFMKMIGDEWMLITAGTPGDYNTMTASWGGVGELWGRPVAFVFIRPQRYTYQFTEHEEMMTLSFLDHDAYKDALTICGTKSGRDGDKVDEAGITPMRTESGNVAFGEAHTVLECRKLYAQDLQPGAFVDKTIPAKIYPTGDFHCMYVVEIVAAYTAR